MLLADSPVHVHAHMCSLKEGFISLPDTCRHATPDLCSRFSKQGFHLLCSWCRVSVSGAHATPDLAVPSASACPAILLSFATDKTNIRKSVLRPSR